MQWLANPLVRMFLSKVSPKQVSLETIQTVLAVVGPTVKMDPVVLNAVVETIRGQEDFPSVLAMLESETARPLLQLFHEPEKGLEGQVTQCPVCKSIFELGVE